MKKLITRALKQLDLYIDAINDSSKPWTLPRLAKMITLKEQTADLTNAQFFEQPQITEFISKTIYNNRSSDENLQFVKFCYEKVQLDYDCSLFRNAMLNATFIFDKDDRINSPSSLSFLTYPLKTCSPFTLLESTYYANIYGNLKILIDDGNFGRSVNLRDAMQFFNETLILANNADRSYFFLQTMREYLKIAHEVNADDPQYLFDFVKYFFSFEDQIPLNKRIQLRKHVKKMIDKADLSILRFDQLVYLLEKTDKVTEIDLGLANKLEDYGCSLNVMTSYIEEMMKKGKVSKFSVFFVASQLRQILANESIDVKTFENKVLLAFGFICQFEKEVNFNETILEFFEHFKRFLFTAKFSDGSSISQQAFAFIREEFAKVENYKDRTFDEYLKRSENVIGNLSLII